MVVFVNIQFDDDDDRMIGQPKFNCKLGFGIES